MKKQEIIKLAAAALLTGLAIGMVICSSSKPKIDWVGCWTTNHDDLFAPRLWITNRNLNHIDQRKEPNEN